MILLRWLRARKWNVDDAIEQLMDTLKWRIASNLNQIVANGESELSHDELLTGKTFYVGRDREGRPIDYISVKDHIKGQFTSEETEKLTIFYMETGRKLLHTPVEAVTVIFDMTGFGMKNMDYQHVKFLLNLLTNYYPESLGLALIINAPWVFNGCWYIIKPWLDPVVESKVHFIKNSDHLDKYIDLSNLPKRLNGNQPDYNYVPPTKQDQLMLSAFRDDHYGRTKATENHLEASKNYLRVTLEWIHENDNKHLLEDRDKAMNQLKYAYEQLIPYISTKTHYHRIGYIHEPIFDITYQNILQREQENITHF